MIGQSTAMFVYVNDALWEAFYLLFKRLPCNLVTVNKNIICSFELVDHLSNFMLPPLSICRKCNIKQNNAKCYFFNAMIVVFNI